jgi:hypothetical protein
LDGGWEGDDDDDGAVVESGASSEDLGRPDAITVVIVGACCL